MPPAAQNPVIQRKTLSCGTGPMQVRRAARTWPPPRPRDRSPGTGWLGDRDPTYVGGCARGRACMGGPQSAQPARGDRPAGSKALVLLAGPVSPAERVLVTRWLRDGDLRPSAVLPLDGPDFARSLDRAVPETVVTAVRVAWLPRERGG